MGYAAFLDFEFSQGTSFPKEEIISMGCTILDKDFNEVNSFYSLCRPRVNRKLSPRIMKITKIRQRDINEAPSFIRMMNSFIKIVKKYPDIKFYSWGNDDWKVFKDELEINKCYWVKKYVPEIIDLQIEIFDSLRNGHKKLFVAPKKLTYMNDFYNAKPLEAHNALNDARMLSGVYKAKKLRGRYFFTEQSFEFMEHVSKEDMERANRTAKELKKMEKSAIIKRMSAIYKDRHMSRILDGNLYHIIEPILDEPLFEKKKHRKYTNYIVDIIFDMENIRVVVRIKSKDKIIEKYLDVETERPLIRSILHFYSGNRRRQKNWKK